MEDAATAEIARVQLWQWAHYTVPLSTSSSNAPSRITPPYIDKIIDHAARESVPKMVSGVSGTNIEIAANYLKEQIRKEWPSEFLTSDLMGELEKIDGGKWVRSSL